MIVVINICLISVSYQADILVNKRDIGSRQAIVVCAVSADAMSAVLHQLDVIQQQSDIGVISMSPLTKSGIVIVFLIPCFF